MNRIPVAIFFILVFFGAFAQDRERDSLKQLLSTNPDDTTKCKVLLHLITLADNEWPGHYTQLKALIDEKLATVAAEGRSYRFYMTYLAKTYGEVGYTLMDEGKTQEALDYFENSLDIAQKINDKQQEYIILNNTGALYFQLGDTAGCLRHFTQSLILAYRMNDNAGIAEGLGNFAVVYKNMGNYQKAIEYGKRSLQLSEKMGDKSGKASILFNLGILYHHQGDIASALSNYAGSRKLFEELKNEKGIAHAMNSIGIICAAQGDTAKALEYFRNSLGIYKKINNASGKVSVYLDMANLYVSREPEKSLVYYTKALEICESSDNKRQISACFHGMAVIYMLQGNVDKSLAYNLKNLAIEESLGDKRGISYTLCNIGPVYYTLGQKKKAFGTLNKALKLAHEIGDAGSIEGIARHLYELYEKEGDAKKAFTYYKLHVKMKDSLENAKTQKAMLTERLQYEFEKKEMLSKAQSEKKITAFRLSYEEDRAHKNIWISVLISVSVLLLAGSFFLFNYFRQRNVIARQKENILKQKLLVSQMNPHFIFNSLNAIQNYIFKQDSLKAGIYLSQFAELMRMILDLSRRDFISIEQEVKLLTHYLELQQLRFDNKFDFTITVDEQIDPSVVQIPPMLAQPFIENAIEHGIFYKTGRGKVTVSLLKDAEQLIYTIEDDGVGLQRSAELNKKNKPAHESLATIITSERITAMNAGIRLEITDLDENSAGHSGVKVRFAVPYKEV